MPTEMERKAIKLLKGGSALSAVERQGLIADLGKEGRDALRRIARGELEVEHPKLRGKAVSALGFDEGERRESVKALRGLLTGNEPILAVLALRALARLDPKTIADEARGLVRNEGTRPELALAAARVAAVLGGSEITAELRTLRKRLREMVPNESSPSILSLDQLINRSEAGGGQPPSTGPKPVI